MRVMCPHCKEKFDVAHSAVLAEAARLKDGRRAGVKSADAPDGNRLDPYDAEAALLKREAVERRLKEAEEDRIARDMLERRLDRHK